MTDVLTFLHQLGARVLLAFAIVLALWGTYLYFRRHAVTGGFRSSYLILAALIPVQGLAGMGLFIAGVRPHDLLHMLLHMVYGVFAVLFVPGAYVYVRGASKRREALYLAGAAWIVSIAFYRGFATS